MKKKLKHKVHALKQHGKRVVSRKHKSEDNLPRITNDTVAEHREEVLSSARKYIYPLQHSRHRIVVISVSLFVIAITAFFTYTLLALYKFHSTSGFVYRITQVLPLPIAKADSNFVSYENYLFEVRRYMHYYSTQQHIDFSSKSGKEQLSDFKRRALDSVINDAYVKQIAKENHITVSRGEVNDQINLLKSQNRLGGSNQVFEDVLREFWDWSPDDFRRELKQQLLAQKVVSKLDTKTHKSAEDALAQLQGGADFATLAKTVSEDEATKPGGGEYGFLIERSNRDVQPQVLNELVKLQPNQTSGIIETPLGLEIVKVYDNAGGKIRAAHIAFGFDGLDTYIDPLKKQDPPSKFVSL